MALAHHRTSSGHTASTATAATMTATSPPSPAGPPHPCPVVGTRGTTTTNSSTSSCFSNLTAVLVVLVCFSFVAVCLLYAARFLLHCWLDRLRRAAREPKPPSDAGDAGGASPVGAGVWAEAECAICLAEFIDVDDPEGGERERVRVRVLPACGHGFHAACVEAWLATRASCPTCRAPSSRPPSRTTARQP